MKIGILTLPLHTNYGGILQAFALQTYLKNRGHEVVLIDRRWNKDYLSRIKHFLKFQKRSDYKKISVNTSRFINTHINPKTKPISSESQLKKVVSEYQFDLIVVGSDQVWRLDYTKEFSDNFFLNFIENKKTLKASYSASFGEDYWDQPAETTKKISGYLKQFDIVSVREDSAVKLCKEYFNVKAEHHVDPTMLLSTKDYTNLIHAEKTNKNENDILVYMLDITDDRKEAIKLVSNQLNSTPFYINVKSKNPKDKIEDRICPKVTNWIQGFYDAKFVITDSFHGCVFSIIFNKPFVAYGNKERGLTRFISVLKMFGLEKRLILNKDELNSSLVKEKIDWNRVNDILSIQQSKSDDFFKRINF